MSNTAISWGGSVTFASQSDLEAGTDSIKPADPAGLSTYNYWLIDTTVTILLNDLMSFSG